MNDVLPRQTDLQAAAKQVMIENGFEPEFSPQVQQELEKLKAHGPKIESSPNIRDLRNLLWSSIDNETSRDLDQAEVAERLPDGETKILVAIADVDAFVPKGSAIAAPAAWENSARPYTQLSSLSLHGRQPAVEGLLAQGQQGADVGDKLRVKLIKTDSQRGYIDFARD